MIFYFRGLTLWPAHLRILKNSRFVVLAIDEQSAQVIGFITAISDGVMSAHIPLLEVLPDHRGRGVGTELVRQMLDQCEGLYMVDTTCDAALAPFYARCGLQPAVGMMIRNYGNQSGRVCRARPRK